MRLVIASLCDAAVIREGLLQVLGAGINRLTRTSLPAPIDVELALMFQLESEDEARAEHSVTVALLGPDGEDEVGSYEMGWGPSQGGDVPRPFPLVPLPSALRWMPVEAYGHYELRVALDGESVASLPFLVQPPEENVRPQQAEAS